VHSIPNMRQILEDTIKLAEYLKNYAVYFWEDTYSKHEKFDDICVLIDELGQINIKDDN
jgi:hypothetical protein